MLCLEQGRRFSCGDREIEHQVIWTGCARSYHLFLYIVRKGGSNFEMSEKMGLDQDSKKGNSSSRKGYHALFSASGIPCGIP